MLSLAGTTPAPRALSSLLSADSWSWHARLRAPCPPPVDGGVTLFDSAEMYPVPQRAETQVRGPPLLTVHRVEC